MIWLLLIEVIMLSKVGIMLQMKKVLIKIVIKMILLTKITNIILSIKILIKKKKLNMGKY